MTPERRREIEDEEALRASLQKRQRHTLFERWGCMYPLAVLGFLLLLMLGIGLYLWLTGATPRW